MTDVTSLRPVSEDLRERLAALEHERWANWQRYMHSLCAANADGSLTIPAALVERWEKQIASPYEHLSEQEKKSDRAEADKTLALLNRGSRGRTP